VSRNRSSTTCDCGHQLRLRDSFTRALYFKEYLALIGIKEVYNYRYYLEYDEMIGCGVICPHCNTKYYFWIGGTHYVKETNKRYPVHFDTSYWESFHEEP